MKVYLDTVGCRLNQSEIETYARQFRVAGHTLVASMDEADLMVLNSCSVTAAAASDSRQKIRQANHMGVEKIVVTGCMSTLEPEKTAAMSGVVQIVPNAEKDTLVADFLNIEVDKFDQEPLAREPIPGSRMRTRAFIKVQDGCDNRCTFCITTVARGEGRSRPVEEVVKDINVALDGGVKEVVLTGVHLGSWGYDFERPRHLRDLIEKILQATDMPRLRISSLEPWDLEAEFFDLWQDPRLCRHLHLPIQSGSASVLRRMVRKTTPKDYAILLDSARARIPDVAITTDLIAGFPGETDEEFEETRKFVEEMNFAGAHVFTYSAREGTAAARMPDRVHNYTRKERSAVLREITATSAQAFRSRFLGKQVDVLWESLQPEENQHWSLTGLTDNYLRVKTTARLPVWNQITPTKLNEVNGNNVRGEIVEYPNSIAVEN
jgi:threonylcarbamoyladenosine tRNA methylthiotransferase MtaB